MTELCLLSAVYLPPLYLLVCSVLGLYSRLTMDSNDIRSCTVVFSLSKGPQIVPLDFAPHLDIVAGRIRGFGTVGVGHIWHLTLTSQCYVEDLIAQGDFVLKGRAVKVSKLSTALLSAVLFWLPFWVSHDDVLTSLGELLHDQVASEYVRIDQKGFPGCYSTQRKITAAADMRNLPHFVTVKSEGHSYRTFLFVPGRPPACFACNSIGHMKNSCPSTSKLATLVQPTPDVPAPAVSVSADPVSDPRASEVQSLPSADSGGSAAPLQLADPAESAKSLSAQSLSVLQEAAATTYVQETVYLEITKSDGTARAYARDGVTLVVTTPIAMSLERLQLFCKLKTTCTGTMCHVIPLWQDGLLAALIMRNHLAKSHPTIRLMEV